MKVSKVNLNSSEEIAYLEEELAAIGSFHEERAELQALKRLQQRNNIKEGVEQLQDSLETNGLHSAQSPLDPRSKAAYLDNAKRIKLHYS